jgi:hypothetical protein
MKQREFITLPGGAHDLLHLLTTACGTSRRFVATQQFGRFRSEADIKQAALTEPNL